MAENERYLRKLDRAPSFDAVFVLEVPLGRPYALFTLQMWNPRESTARVTGNTWAIYAEDQWKPSTNLSVTLGLRLDHEEIDAPGWHMDDPRDEAQQFFKLLNEGVPVPQITRTVFTGFEDASGFVEELANSLGISPSQVTISPELVQSTFWAKNRRREDIHLINDNFSPRLSMAWDPWSHGKTKIALSAGRYYDKIFLAVPLVEVEPLETRNSFISGSFNRLENQVRSVFF